MMLTQIHSQLAAFFVQLFGSEIFIATLCAFLAAQLGKALQLSVRQRSFSPRLLLRRASMPSSHTATMSGLTVSIFLAQGMTAVTVAAFFMMMVVIRDSLDVNLGIPPKENIQRRSYVHKPREVLVGALIGVIVPFLIF